jgi:hypothetical protein
MIEDKTQEYYQLTHSEYLGAKRLVSCVGYKEVEEVVDKVWCVNDDDGNNILTKEVSVFGDKAVRFYVKKDFFLDVVSSKLSDIEKILNDEEHVSLEGKERQALMQKMENFEKRMVELEEELSIARKNDTMKTVVVPSMSAALRMYGHYADFEPVFIELLDKFGSQGKALEYVHDLFTLAERKKMELIDVYSLYEIKTTSDGSKVFVDKDGNEEKL